MSISSINTNLSALLAQSNIGNATTNTSNNVAALSSGNRIVNASTDVAALATGTGLQSQVNVLNVALSSASQAGSLLQVADGALSQIQTILQRQQAIATQAQSGSLSSTQRGFLDQEFQALSSEIDQLAGSSNFNGVNLLDGSIAGNQSISTNSTNGTTTLPPAATVATIASNTGLAGSTLSITVSGQPTVSVTFGSGSTQVGVGTTVAHTAANLAASLNNSGLSELANFRFTSDSTGNLKAYYTGSAASTSAIPTLTTATSNSTAVTGTGAASFSAATSVLTLSGTAGVGDTITIGTHSVTLVANGTNTNGYDSSAHVDLGLSTATGGVSGGTLTNLAAYLNANAGGVGFTDLTGVSFSTNTAGTALVATYSGSSSTPPTLSTSYTSHTSATLSGNTSQAVSAGTTVFTVGDNGDFVAGATNGSTLTIGGKTVHFAANGSNTGGYDAGTDTVDIGSNLTGTLANIAAYLNDATTNAALTGSLAGVKFGSDATKIYAANNTNADIGSVTTNLYNALPSGTSGRTAASIAASGTANIITSTTSNLNAGNTITVAGGITYTLVAGTAGTHEIQLGGSLATTLSNIATQLTTDKVANGYNAAFNFSSDATHVIVTNSSGGALTDISISLAGGSTHLPTDVSVASSATIRHADAVGSFSGTISSGDAILVGTAANVGGTPLFTSSTSVDIGGAVTFGTQAQVTAGTRNVVIGNDNFETLSNLATYLNGSTVNAALTGSYAGLTFSTDGKHLIATNSTASTITTSTNATLTSGPTGSAGYTAGAIAAGATANILTLATQTIKFGTAAQVTAGTANVVTGGSLSTSLSRAATYLNTGSYTGTTYAPVQSHTAFATNGTQLFAQSDSSSGATISTTYTTSQATGTGVQGVNLSTIAASGLGAGVTSAVGTPTGSLFVTSTGAASGTNYGAAVDLSGVANNASFVGKFGGTGSIGAITATYVNTGTTSTSGLQLSVKVGNDTYSTATITNSTLTGTAPVALTFTGSNNTSTAAEGGSFTLTLQPQSTISSQNSADQLAAGINAALADVSAYQNRGVLSFNNNFSATVGGTQTGTLQGASLTLNSGDFSNPSITSITVSAPSTGTTDAKISASINGHTFSTISGIGNTFSANNQIVLVNNDTPTETVTLTLGSSGSADLSTSDNAKAFQTALEKSLGLDKAGTGLSFQVGATSADTINVTIGSAKTSSLFGSAQNVLTQASAEAAGTAVGNALNTVTALRATVGALEERFNYSSSAIQNAVQNQGAAKSNLLDTDVAATSTAFATSQVQLQAGIAVLAQANQLQQNLLKLIQ